jgi:hypothetical protein
MPPLRIFPVVAVCVCVCERERERERERVEAWSGSDLLRGLVWQTFVRQGLRSEALRNVGWYNAGLLMRKERRWEEAEKSLRTAVGLALTAPVMSFHKLPRPL